MYAWTRGFCRPGSYTFESTLRGIFQIFNYILYPLKSVKLNLLIDKKTSNKILIIFSGLQLHILVKQMKIFTAMKTKDSFCLSQNEGNAFLFKFKL